MNFEHLLAGLFQETRRLALSLPRNADTKTSAGFPPGGILCSFLGSKVHRPIGLLEGNQRSWQNFCLVEELQGTSRIT